MARASSNTGCLCRVPVTEAAIPAFSTTHQLEEWARDEGVEIAPDHMGRLSISLADAYRLYAEQAAVTNAHARAEAEAKAKESAEIKAAQEHRQRTYTEAYSKAVASGKSSAEASAMAWTAVHKAEQGFSRRLLDRLGSVRIPRGVA